MSFSLTLAREISWRRLRWAGGGLVFSTKKGVSSPSSWLNLGVAGLARQCLFSVGCGLILLVVVAVCAHNNGDLVTDMESIGACDWAAGWMKTARVGIGVGACIHGVGDLWLGWDQLHSKEDDGIGADPDYSSVTGIDIGIEFGVKVGGGTRSPWPDLDPSLSWRRAGFYGSLQMGATSDGGNAGGVFPRMVDGGGGMTASSSSASGHVIERTWSAAVRSAAASGEWERLLGFPCVGLYWARFGIPIREAGWEALLQGFKEDGGVADGGGGGGGVVMEKASAWGVLSKCGWVWALSWALASIFARVWVAFVSFVFNFLMVDEEFAPSSTSNV